MVDCNGDVVRVGTRVAVLPADGVVKPGSKGVIVKVSELEALIKDKAGDDFTWGGWYPPRDFVRLSMPDDDAAAHVVAMRAKAFQVDANPASGYALDAALAKYSAALGGPQ